MNQIINSATAGTLPLEPVETNPVATVGSGFSKVIESTINQAIKAEAAGDQAINDLQSGEAKNLHDVMISVEKADISLKMLVQFRNKAMQAYEEIMRMQI